MTRSTEIHLTKSDLLHTLTNKQAMATLAEYDPDAIVYVSSNGTSTPATLLYLSQSDAIIFMPQTQSPPDLMTAQQFIDTMKQYGTDDFVVLMDDNNPYKPVFSRKNQPVIIIGEQIT